MDPVDLDPGGYPGTYKLVGGRPSLDLVNTVSWPGTDQEHDWLGVPSNVERWLTAVGLAVVPVDADDLAAVRQVREVLSAVLRPLSLGHEPAGGALDDLNDLLAPAAGRRRVSARSAWEWAPPGTVTEALAPVVVDAAEVAVEADRRRLRHCPSCDWAFLDTTRNNRRRWCDMADCGSRAKSRRYYHRHSR